MTNNFMCFPGGKTKALTFSYDDGKKEDRRLVELFNKYGLKGTFNLNSQFMIENDGKPEVMVGISEIPTLYKGHEVAAHGLTHPFLEKLPSDAMMHEVVEDRKNLEKYSKNIVRGMAYPFGTYNDTVVRVLKDAGIRYSRTCEAHHGFKISRDWLRMPSTCHHADEKLFDIANEFVNGNPTARWTNTEGWLFYVWGHSYEFRTEQDWQRIEEFFKMVASKQDTWYATNLEIYNYVTAFDSLEYSLDLKMIHNPSAIDVWIRHADKDIICISAGETVCVE